MNAVAPWLADRRVALAGLCEPLPFDQSQEWSLQDGALRHRTGGFFAVRGVEARADGQPWHGAQFPMIDQPEVGLLAFAVSRGEDGWSWLLQAKAEPGTVGWVQAGPTVQATESNYRRRHGGRPTRFLDLFVADGAVAPDGLPQSEQGSRFIGKYNKNAVREVTRFDPGHPNWVWFGARAIREALGRDFEINTDARSVIVSSPWRRLRDGGGLFTGSDSGAERGTTLRPALASSYASAPRPHRLAEALDLIEARRALTTVALRRVPIEAMSGWRWTVDAIMPSEARPVFDTQVVMRRIEAIGREVEAWDQPFLASDREHKAVLLLSVRSGTVEVALRGSIEPGFGRHVQFGPTWQSDLPGPARLGEAVGEAQPIVAVRQSDEGGRFLNVVMRYEIALLEQDPEGLDDPDLVWVTLSELERLCRTAGLLTNEARSLVSVLLSLA